MLGGVPHQGGLLGQLVRVTRFGGVSFLHVKAAKWGNPPTRGNQITWACELFGRFDPQNAAEIDSAGENWSVESDSQANQRNQKKSFACNNDVKAKSSFIRTNDSSLFMCVLSDQVIAFWTSPRVPGAACEDKYFFTTGRWGTSPLRPGSPTYMWTGPSMNPISRAS